MYLLDSSVLLSDITPTIIWYFGSMMLPMMVFFVLSIRFQASSTRFFLYALMGVLCTTFLLLFLGTLETIGLLDAVSNRYLNILLSVALPEELCKLFGFFLVVRLSIKKTHAERPTWLRQHEGSLGFVSGFIGFETVLYMKGFLLNETLSSDWFLYILNRNFCAGSLHLATMIVLLSTLHVRKKRTWIFCAFLFNSLYHAAFNTLVDVGYPDSLFYVMGLSFLSVSVLLLWRISKNGLSDSSPAS